MRLRRLKHFSTIRWTSHDRAIIVIYEKFKAHKETLKYLSEALDSDRETSYRASSLASTITSFKFIITMIFMQKIFSITSPLLKCLQSKSLDFIQAVVLVNKAKKSLSNLRTDEEFMKLVNEAQHFSRENDLIETEFKEVRIRKKKRMSGEIGQDKHQSSASYFYKTMVYFTVFDSVITSISNRFNESKGVLKDLSILSLTRLMSFGKEKNPSIPILNFKNSVNGSQNLIKPPYKMNIYYLVS
jgi:uncharacterized membrane protein YheB (UPF0754 family)